jgi:hypothetical protein
MRWLDSDPRPRAPRDRGAPRQFLLNLICFAACIEGLFFFGAFAYVYFLRSRACCTAWRRAPTGCSATRAPHGLRVRGGRDTVRREEPELFDAALERDILYAMIDEAIDCETQFAEDLLAGGVAGLSVRDMRTYLQYCADQRLPTWAAPRTACATRSASWTLQDVQELDQLLRAPGVGLPGRRHRRGRARRGVLSAFNDNLVPIGRSRSPGCKGPVCVASGRPCSDVRLLCVCRSTRQSRSTRPCTSIAF